MRPFPVGRGRGAEGEPSVGKRTHSLYCQLDTFSGRFTSRRNVVDRFYALNFADIVQRFNERKSTRRTLTSTMHQSYVRAHVTKACSSLFGLLLAVGALLHHCYMARHMHKIVRMTKTFSGALKTLFEFRKSFKVVACSNRDGFTGNLKGHTLYTVRTE